MSEEKDLSFARDLMDCMASNLTMLVDRDITVEEVQVSREEARPAGAGSVHISFKLELRGEGGEVQHGCVLVPLADARALACYLMMFPDDEVKDGRKRDDLEQPEKSALLELGNFVGASVEEAARNTERRISVKSTGCQGVRPDVRPAFPYEEGAELFVVRAQTKVHDFPAFELIGMFPASELAA